MRRALLVVAVALVLPAPAAAKPRAVALEVCGPGGCTAFDPPDLGHAPPLQLYGYAPPLQPLPFHQVEVRFDFGAPLRVYYVAGANRFAALTGGAWRYWYSAEGPLGAAVRKAVASVRPFPAPQLTRTERALIALTRTAPMPLTGKPLTIRLRTTEPSPWRRALIGYFYAARKVLCRPYSTCVRVPRELAAQLERSTVRRSLAAAAKFRLALTLSDATPRVGQAVRVRLRADADAGSDAVMRLLAVPPGTDMYGALRSESSFAVPLVRTSAQTWRAIVRFRRAGRWLLVVPNWGAPGYAIPPPVVRPVTVTRA